MVSVPFIVPVVSPPWFTVMVRTLKEMTDFAVVGFAPIFPYTFYHLIYYRVDAADIPVANGIPVHCADAIRCSARTPSPGSLPLLVHPVS